MVEQEDRYDFRPVTEKDLPMIAGWLAEPHVAKWWDGDPQQNAEHVVEAMESIETRPMIVELEGRPIAYLQHYDPHLEDGHPYQDQPKGTLGLDISIGIPALIGKGHGSAIIRQIASELFAGGTKRIVIDPHPENHAAIRAYEKAGFRYLDTRTSIYGPAHFMVLDANQETDLQ